MQDRNLVIGFRAGPSERQKLEGMAAKTGKPISELLRELVKNATLQSVWVVQATSTVGMESNNAQ